ncbi:MULTISPECIES: hypothetical protein [Streptomyces]|uniref:hypothetical protein n=1 Tax=Streptomyces TaxID=1883 RepID=UPI003654CBCF
MDAAGLQRGRLTGLILKGDDLLDADQVARQLSLDDAPEARLAAEGAVDRIRVTSSARRSSAPPSSSAVPPNPHP